MKNIIRIVIGIVFSIFAIYIISKHIDFKQLVITLKLFDLRLIIVLLLFYPTSIYIRCLRWRCLIEQKVDPPNQFLIGAMMVGFFANYFLPAKMGEVLRAELVKQKIGTSRSFILTTVFIERLLDAIVLLIFLLFSALFSKTIKNLMSRNIYNILFLVLVFAFVIFTILNRKLLNFLMSFIPRLSRKSDSILKNIYLAFGFFKRKIVFAKVFLLTVALWLILTLYYIIIAHGLNINLPYYGYLFLISMAAFGMILPASPGNIGVYHGIVMAAILIFIPNENEKALSFAIISHAFDLIPAVLFGFISVQYFGFSLKINANKNETD